MQTRGKEGHTGRAVKLFITDACIVDAVPKLPSTAAGIGKRHHREEPYYRNYQVYKKE
ncbi:hypothetical protein [Paenibacillus thiaminolyticus]|uniref:hypothetical protein n=1 Tax=Paenibacillus thiaminolyticus TaxID=49283 RepID=UPI001C719AD6|nr:hypothetical protein [Paenibacillus thiaminolyticus]